MTARLRVGDCVRWHWQRWIVRQVTDHAVDALRLVRLEARRPKWRFRGVVLDVDVIVPEKECERYRKAAGSNRKAAGPSGDVLVVEFGGRATQVPE